MGCGFTLPPATCAAIREIEDGALGRTLEILFRLQVDGQIPDTRGEQPIVKVALALASSAMDAWARRAAQNREAQARRRRSLMTSATSHADVMLTSAKEGKEEAKEKVPPTPPYKEKEKEKDQEMQPGACACDARIGGWFAAFWNAYPRKVAKRQAESAFSALFRAVGKAKREHLFRDVMHGVERDRASRDWTKEGGRFVPHPTTYIHQERWKQYDGETQEIERNAEADALASRLLATAETRRAAV